MGTRCAIEVVEGNNRYRIYRHFDGYPGGVLADIRLILDKTRRGREYGFNDPEYLLANLIFFAKLTAYEAYKGTKYSEQRSWELGYGVCAPDCEHGDLKYKYIIDALSGTVEIQERKWEEGRFVSIFRGYLDEAFEKFVVGSKFEHGCHVNEELLDAINAQIAKLEVKKA